MKNITLIALSFLAFFTTVEKVEMLPEYQDVEFNSPLPIQDTLAILQAGSMLFHLGCETCHNISKAGFSDSPVAVGGLGIFDIMRGDLDPTHHADFPDLRTPAVICSDKNFNGLYGGELGGGGLNDTIDRAKLVAFKNQNLINADGIYVQVNVATAKDAHDLSAMVDRASTDTLIANLLMKGLGVGAVNNLSVMVAIGVYEKSVRPTEAPLVKHNADVTKLASLSGFNVYQDKCSNCHGKMAEGHDTIAIKASNSDFVGRFRMTKDSSDIGMLKVPPLYNMEDAPCYFHSCEDVSLYRAIQQCAGVHGVEIGWRDTYRLRSFLRNDVTDPYLDRYLRYTKLR